MTESSTEEGDDRDKFLVHGDSGGSPPAVRTRTVVFSKAYLPKGAAIRSAETVDTR